jgi:hypothetical protein
LDELFRFDSVSLLPRSIARPASASSASSYGDAAQPGEQQYRQGLATANFVAKIKPLLGLI